MDESPRRWKSSKKKSAMAKALKRIATGYPVTYSGDQSADRQKAMKGPEMQSQKKTGGADLWETHSCKATLCPETDEGTYGKPFLQSHPAPRSK